MLGRFDQSLDKLAVVVAGENLFGIRLGGQNISVEMGIRSAVLAAGHQLSQDDAHGMTAVGNTLRAQFADTGKQAGGCH
jgi:hypothetical protein